MSKEDKKGFRKCEYCDKLTNNFFAGRPKNSLEWLCPKCYEKIKNYDNIKEYKEAIKKEQAELKNYYETVMMIIRYAISEKNDELLIIMSDYEKELAIKKFNKERKLLNNKEINEINLLIRDKLLTLIKNPLTEQELRKIRNINHRREKYLKLINQKDKNY